MCYFGLELWVAVPAALYRRIDVVKHVSTVICRPLGNIDIIIMIIMIFALCFDAAYVTPHIFNSSFGPTYEHVF